MNIDKYRSLFVHRDDVFAEQQTSGAYFPVRRPLDDEDIQEHLAGGWSIGTYVIDPAPHAICPDDYADGHDTDCQQRDCRNTVSNIVFDLDTYDEEALTFLCREVERLTGEGLQRHHFPWLMLENSGGKGFHVWLFLSEPVAAARARAFAESVRVEYDNHTEYGQLRPWPTLEIFPKQDTVEDGGFGNLVKLPLGVHAKTGNRSEIVVKQGWANSVDNVQRFDTNLIPQVAAPLPRPGAARGEGGLRQAPFACIARIHDEGAPQGCRDLAMVHLAHYCFGTGVMDYEQVLDTCLRANEEFDPPLAQSVVAQKVRSAQRLQAAHPSCRADWLRDFCPGGESCYAPWNTQRDSSERSTETDDYASQSPEERRLRRLGTVGS